DVEVGGRYEASPDDVRCSRRPDGTYDQVRTPWLVPGFDRNTTTDAATGLRYRHECRDANLPFHSNEPSEQEAFRGRNLSLALSNIIPDGRKRRRSLRLIDGAMINQNVLFIIFEERFDSFLDPNDTEGFSAYGYMVLSKEAVELDEADTNLNNVPDVYEGSGFEDGRDEPTDLLDVTCDPGLLRQVFPGDSSPELRADNAEQALGTLLDGVAPAANPAFITPQSVEQVHYFCEDTGLFDGGLANTSPHDSAEVVVNDDTCASFGNGVCEDGGPNAFAALCGLGTDLTDCGPRADGDFDERVVCPTGSRVTYFTVNRQQLTQADIAALPCQQDGTCQETLNQWRSGAPFFIQYDPVWQCTDPNQAFCSANRHDLRADKVFYEVGQEEAVFVPFQAAVNGAFRYKIRFRNRTGQGVGFAPQICL
ncbi:MAG: hypothetical protein AAFS10_28270, partial [Myxococcota bacterium]